MLRRVLSACLVLLAHPGSHCDAARGVFQAAGIASDRVAFAAPGDRRGYFEGYAEIDLSLDPFPYNGHTTALD